LVCEALVSGARGDGCWHRVGISAKARFKRKASAAPAGVGIMRGRRAKQGGAGSIRAALIGNREERSQVA
jgi:hypothetical protein